MYVWLCVCGGDAEREATAHCAKAAPASSGLAVTHVWFLGATVHPPVTAGGGRSTVHSELHPNADALGRVWRQALDDLAWRPPPDGEGSLG